MDDTTGTGLPSLEDAKKVMCDQIDNIRSSYMSDSFIYNGHRWDSDAISRSNLLGTLKHAEHNGGLPPEFVWRDYDNNYVPMTVTEMGALAEAMFNFINQCYLISWEHKDSINALMDVTAVLGYDCNTNWDTLPI